MSLSQPSATTTPDPRSKTDRRQRDGLGLLPRTTSRWERRRRQELNRALGWLLFLLGLTAWSAGLIDAVRFGVVTYLLGPLLGLFIAVRGFQLMTWLERRKVDRRRGGQVEALVTEPEAPAPSRSNGSWPWRRGRLLVPPREELQVTPPTLD